MPSKKRFLYSLQIIVAVAAAALLWELILRTFVLKHPTIETDAQWGRRFPPYAQVTWGTEGLGRMQMDAYGFNNDPQPTDWLQSLTRIAILGDSHTEALQVPREENFSSLLQTRLGPNRQVLNLGMGDNSLAHYLLTAKTIQDHFRPDIVVVQVTAEDFTADAFNPAKSVRLAVKPEGGFTLVTQIGLAPIQKIKQKLSSVPMMGDLLEASLIKYGFQRAQRLRDSFQVGETVVASPEERASAEPSYDVSKAIHWELSELRKTFPTLMIVYLPWAPMMEGKAVKLVEDQKYLAVKSILIQETARLDIPFVDITDSFVRDFQEHKTLPRGFGNTRPGFGHLNARGHDLVAKEIQRALYTHFSGEL